MAQLAISWFLYSWASSNPDAEAGREMHNAVQMGMMIFIDILYIYYRIVVKVINISITICRLKLK